MGFQKLYGEGVRGEANVIERTLICGTRYEMLWLQGSLFLICEQIKNGQPLTVTIKYDEILMSLEEPRLVIFGFQMLKLGLMVQITGVW